MRRLNPRQPKGNAGWSRRRIWTRPSRRGCTRRSGRRWTTPDYRRTLDEFDLTPHYRTAQTYRGYAEAQLAKEKAMLDESGFKLE